MIGMPPCTGRKSAHTHSGFALIELTVVLALIGIIGGMIGVTLVRQQRFYRSASELLYARAGVRDAIEVLATDIRGLAVADTVRVLANAGEHLDRQHWQLGGVPAAGRNRPAPSSLIAREHADFPPYRT